MGNWVGQRIVIKCKKGAFFLLLLLVCLFFGTKTPANIAYSLEPKNDEQDNEKIASLQENNNLEDDELKSAENHLPVLDEAQNVESNSAANVAAIKPRTMPVLAFELPVQSEIYDLSPAIVFNSSVAGTITYQNCSSTTTHAVAGRNFIELSTMPEGTYTNCAITVTNGGDSATLNLPTFTVKKPRRSALWKSLRTMGIDYDDKACNNPIEGAWLATHHDVIITGNVRKPAVYDIMKAANPDVVLMTYVSMYTTVEAWLENWVQTNYPMRDVEDLFYHYEHDTVFNVNNGTTVNVAGWPLGSALTQKESRIPSAYGFYTTYCPHSDLYREAFLAYCVEQFTVNAAQNKYVDAVFIDGWVDSLHDRQLLHTTAELGPSGLNLTYQQALAYQAQKLVQMQNEIEIYLSALAGKDVQVAGNMAEAYYPYLHPYSLVGSQAYSPTFNELFIEFLTYHGRTSYKQVDTIKNLYDDMDSGVSYFINSQTGVMEQASSGYSPQVWEDYIQHIVSTQHLISHENGYYSIHFGGAGYYGGVPQGNLRKTHWHSYYEFDYGEPVVHGNQDYWGATGTDRFYVLESGLANPADTRYIVIAREFENALFVSKFGTEGGRYQDAFGQWHGVPTGGQQAIHQLGGQYRRLLPDMTLGPIITEIELGKAGGAILIKENAWDKLPLASPSPDSSPLPSPTSTMAGNVMNDPDVSAAPELPIIISGIGTSSDTLKSMEDEQVADETIEMPITGAKSVSILVISAALIVYTAYIIKKRRRAHRR